MDLVWVDMALGPWRLELSLHNIYLLGMGYYVTRRAQEAIGNRTAHVAKHPCRHSADQIEVTWCYQIVSLEEEI